MEHINITFFSNNTHLRQSDSNMLKLDYNDWKCYKIINVENCQNVWKYYSYYNLPSIKSYYKTLEE